MAQPSKNKGLALMKLHEAVEDAFPAHLERCRAFLRQKSVSASGEGIRETAEWVKDMIEELGGEVFLKGHPDFPIVFGRVRGASPKTLVVYGMYDVQPAEEKGWISPPFDAGIRRLPGMGDCVIARGAVNSKGALCGVFNSLRTMKATVGIPLNLIFTIEGEEEIGSPHFEPFIRENRALLGGDGVVDFDFSQDSKGGVSMHLGLKGIVYLDLLCRGGRKGGPVDTAVHGSVSAWISSPAWRLVHALAALTDEKEDIRIPGFYDNIAPVRGEDLRLLKALEKTFDERAFLKEMKGLCFKGDLHGVALLKKGLYSPIININGVQTGYMGPGTKTILPRKARAKVDIRFGPDMEPEEVVDKFKSHFRKQGFDDIEIRVRDFYSWSKTNFSEPIVQKMIGAYRTHEIRPQVWPMATWAAPYFVFSRILNLPVVSGGLGHGGRQHVANEYMTVKGLKDFEKFVVTFLSLMAEDGGPVSSPGLFRH